MNNSQQMACLTSAGSLQQAQRGGPASSVISIYPTSWTAAGRLLRSAKGAALLGVLQGAAAHPLQLSHNGLEASHIFKIDARAALLARLALGLRKLGGLLGICGHLLAHAAAQSRHM